MQRTLKIYPDDWFGFMMIVAFILILWILFGCKTKEKVTTTHQNLDTIMYVEKITTHYDTIQLPSDSAYVKAYLQCDSAGNVLIRALNEEKGRLRVKTIFRDNIIEVKVHVDSSEIIRQAEREFLRNYKSSFTENTTVVQKKRTFVWYYYFLSGVGFGVIIVLIIKQLWKKFKTVLF